MTTSAFRTSLLTLAILSTPALAQETDKATMAGACTAIATDAERLACYDHALGRRPSDTNAADADANAARLQLEQLKAANAPPAD
ncbi:MAG TPA: phospholipase, partial [Pseudoxanthomonas sp.]|nr:phospholipase [Pseudoxanthomonas sp.]